MGCDKSVPKKVCNSHVVKELVGEAVAAVTVAPVVPEEVTEPANTIITDIKIFCDVSPVIGTGDIGYEVGTSSSGAQIVAAVTDEILDGGTTVVVGNVTTTSLVLQTQSGTTAPASVQYTSAERTIFCNITNTVDATTAGSFTFIIEYVQVA